MQATSHFWRLCQAIAITIIVAALFHLTVASLTFADTHKISYINPISFLGLGSLMPAYTDSVTAAVVAWLAIVGFILCIFVTCGWLGRTTGAAAISLDATKKSGER